MAIGYRIVSGVDLMNDERVGEDEAADIERLTDLVVEVETVESIEDRRPLKLSRRYGNEIRTGSINLFVSERDWIGNSMGNYLTHLWSCFQRDEA